MSSIIVTAFHLSVCMSISCQCHYLSSASDTVPYLSVPLLVICLSVVSAPELDVDTLSVRLSDICLSVVSAPELDVDTLSVWLSDICLSVVSAPELDVDTLSVWLPVVSLLQVSLETHAILSAHFGIPSLHIRSYHQPVCLNNFHFEYNFNEGMSK